MKYVVVEVNGIGTVKRLYVGENSYKAQQVVADYRRAGWTDPFPQPGSVGIVRATSFKEAAKAVWKKQGLPDLETSE